MTGRKGPAVALGSFADWAAVVTEFGGRSVLDARQLDQLAEAQFWTDDVDGSMHSRADALKAHAATGDDAAAAFAAWRLFYDHFLVGEEAVANGWLARGRRHAQAASDPRASAWVRLADADVALRSGRVSEALEGARAAGSVGRSSDDPDLVAMALQVEGRARIASDDRLAGMTCLDEAMVAVINDELQPVFVGWIFCIVVSTCHGVADLRRASEWSDAAMRWCSALRHGRMYRGLCQVYSVELITLRGRWDDAALAASAACDDLEAYDPRYAGDAHYLLGELHRRRGHADEAEAAFARADELGRLPQPGRGLLRLASGDAVGALRELRTAALPGPSAPLARCELLMATLDAAAEAGADQVIDELAEAIGAVADAHPTPLLLAAASTAAGRAALAAGLVDDAVRDLRRATAAYRELDLPYDEASVRRWLAASLSAAGDTATAGAELARSIERLAELDAAPDVERARAHAAELGIDVGRSGDVPGLLTDRERQVLALVADGHTNRAIADELVVSPHTVARHVSNIFTKLGVHSRAAATAEALDRGLLADRARD